MINKEYWDQFYKLDIAPKEESDFAKFVLQYINDNEIRTERLIDVACGNGRDTCFFQKNGIQSSGVDLSIEIENDYVKFIKGDILEFDYTAFGLVYMRFIVHALKESELDILLQRISNSTNNPYIFIETRSSKGINDEPKAETFFKSSIGAEHFRMLYSKEYFTEKVHSKFEILYSKEADNFSVYKSDNPVCLRFILKKKQSN